LFDVPHDRGKLSRLCLDRDFVVRVGERDGTKEVFRVADEIERAKLINDITRLIREPMMPEATRTAGLTLIGWLARRRAHEMPDAIGVPEARESERRLRAARKAAQR
jgi:hypothetical protein